MLELDHVILLVDDLDGAAQWMLADHGLASVAGGRHPGHGTGNRIVPLGDAYVELMAVVDPEEAAASRLGRWARDHTKDRPAPAALCLRTDDADAVAARLGLEPMPMSRRRLDGSLLSWRLVGLDEALGPERLPFFIQWECEPEEHPGRTPAPHRADPTGALRVTLSGDPDRIMARLGAHDLPITIREGEPGLSRVVVETRQGEITL